MSSHREAPEISKDPVADSTDLYAFVSPDKPNTVTLIANYIPLQAPAGGPNFYEFGGDVLYEIHIDNDADALPEITYQFLFQTRVLNPDTFLYNTGPITSNTDPNWNRQQTFTVARVANGVRTVLASGLTCPPCNIGPRSTPNYAGALAGNAIHALPSGETVFAGQRREGFFVDLGSIFDLGALRPYQSAHLIPTPPSTASVDATAQVNVHSIAIQVPISRLTRDGSMPTNAADSRAVIGVWTSASRQKVSVGGVAVGPFTQVSRLGNPLVNEAIIAMGDKDRWNASQPYGDSQFNHYVLHPQLAALLPVLYPGVFPHLAGLTAPRKDLQAILHTGIPWGIIPNFQNSTGTTLADQLRLNMAIPPSNTPNRLGILGGDLAGFPNGRRPQDDIVTIELRAIAGATYPLVDSTFVPDPLALTIDQQIDPTTDPTRYLSTFPYLGTPLDGYNVP
jgi:hypothetical protein